MSIQTTKIRKGFNFHYIHTKKFKTTTLSFYFHRPLNKREVTINALLANLLKRGCPSYPDTAALNRRLDELYGARLECGVRKKGDSQIIYINFEFVNERYIEKSKPVIKSIFELAKEIVAGQTAFTSNYVNQEKENLRRLILALINDKRSYANMRCIEIMCEGEPYGIRELGFEEEIDKINEEQLYNHYKNVILASPVDVFLSGEADINWAQKQLEENFSQLNCDKSAYPCFTIFKSSGKIKRIDETQELAQGKLSLGFVTGINAMDEKFPALLIFNSLFGGGPYSKLFNNVREKLSLAYHVLSRTDLFKGIMIVNSGIEMENFQKAFDEIMLQLEEIKNKNITRDELSAAILTTVNAIRSIADNAVATEDYWLGRLITGKMDGFEELADRLGEVTIDNVVDIAGNVMLDTVYFLTGKEIENINE